MTQIFLDLPQESLLAFDGSKERAEKELRMATAENLTISGRPTDQSDRVRNFNTLRSALAKFRDRRDMLTVSPPQVLFS
ncbi:MAG: hypothetical protein K9K79_13820 [Desulfohalobiaceae bacterium]|nr:hypothetical protein [Desulfohalobiaceae bacterium]